MIRSPDRGMRPLLSNAASLFGTTVVTAGLGAAYWAVAARAFPAAAVGLAAAAISVMTLAGRVATVGLGTVLMSELPQHPGSERSLTITASGVAALVGAGLGAALMLGTYWMPPELDTFRGAGALVVFAIGVSTTSAGFVLDQAFVGLLRGGVQLARNTIASVVKLGLVAAVGLGAASFVRPTGDALFGTWVIGGAISLAIVVLLPRDAQAAGGSSWWRLPNGLMGLALRHHLLNLSILAPSLLMPMLVTVVLSAEKNAYFYIAFTVANLGWAVPAALATALYASGARDLDALSHGLRLSFRLSVATAVAFNLLILVVGRPLLAVFGATYADRSEEVLRVLSLGMFPVTITSMYVPIVRLERRFLQGTVVMIAAMLAAFGGLLAGASMGGLEGAAVGWLLGAVVGTIPLLPTVLRVALRHEIEPVARDLFGQLPTGAARSASRET